MKLLYYFLAISFCILSCKQQPAPKNNKLETISLPETIDSLKLLLVQVVDDTFKMRILDKMAIVETDDSLMMQYDNQLEKLLNTYTKKKISIDEQKLIKKYIANILHRKGFFYRNNNNYTEALKYYHKSLMIREEIDDKKGIATSYNNIGIIYRKKGDYSRAIEFYKKSLKIEEELGDKKGIANSLNNIGLTYSYQGNYKQAVEYHQKSLKIREEIDDKKGIAISLNNIGLIYSEQGDYSRAIEYYQKSLKIEEQIGDKKGIANSLNNIGNIYSYIGDYSRALEYHLKTLKIREEIGDKQDIAASLNNIGAIYSYQGNYSSALEYYQKSLTIKEKIGDKKGIANSLYNIGLIYSDQGNFNRALEYYQKSLIISKEIDEKDIYPGTLSNLSKIYLKQKNVVLAKQYAELAYKIAVETGNIENIRNSAEALDTVYYAFGNYKLSRLYYAEYIKMRDSIQGKEAKKKAIQQYYQYQYEKKAAADSVAHVKAIEIKNLEIEKQKAEVRKNKIIAATSIGGGIIVLTFLIFVYRSLKITKRQKKIIEEQKQLVDSKNEELARQNEEIKQQRDEIQSQRDTIQKQKEEIEIIHNELKSSIYYAQRIQEAVLPSREAGKSIKRPHFIMFRPKDVVSGDFYWYTEIGSVEVYAVADCTGHGVPGGFMSMLGIALLNEIVRKKEVTQANQVLNELRKEIIIALKQKGLKGEQKDGMDISLLVIEKDKDICQWSGANNSLYIISNNSEIENLKSQIENPIIVNSDNGFSLLEFKPDSMPVAIHPMMIDFTNHTFPLPQNAYFYLFSDGFADQFGGEKNKKYGYKRLKKLLLSIANNDIDEQGKIIEQEFYQWKGSNEQIDDVMMLGLCITQHTFS